jgi:hypothetical protein
MGLGRHFVLPMLLFLSLDVVAIKYEELGIEKISSEIIGDAPLEVRFMSEENYPNGDNRIAEVTRNVDYDKLYSEVIISFFG